MNREILQSITRHILTVIAGALATKGLLSQEDADIVVASVVGLIGVGWAVWHKVQAAKQAGSTGPAADLKGGMQ